MTAPQTQPSTQPVSWGWVLIKNAFSAITGTFVVSLIGFILTPFLVQQLGNNRFGLWTLVFSIVMVTELADFGISQGIQRFVAQHAAKNEYDDVTILTNQAFTTVLGIMVLASIPLMLIDMVLPVLFRVPPEFAQETQWTMGILILTMVVLIPLSVYIGGISGFQRYELVNANWIVYSVLRALALAGCVFFSFPLVAMATALLILALLRLASLVVIFRRLCPGYTFRLHKPNRDFFTRVASYGSRLFTISILGRIIYTSDPYLIGLFMGPVYITYYAIASKWSEVFRIMFSGSLQVCFPTFSHLDTLKDHGAIRDILLNGSRTAFGFGILCASLLILFAAPIVYLWVGPGYEASVPIIRWLGMVGIFTSFSFPFEHYLKAVGEVKPLFRAALFNCIFNVAATVFLLNTIGLIGAVWGTLAPLIPTTLLLIIPAACRVASIPLRLLFKQLLVPLALPIAWAFGWGVWFHYNPLTLTSLSATCLWVMAISGGYMLLWMMVDPIPRRIVRSIKRKQSSTS